MKILIKGAGDLATGIASRLYGAGHQILMTEIAQPLTVRRTVALSRAVYDRRAIVEEMEAVSAKTQEDAEAIMEEGKIPVIVDPKADCRKWIEVLLNCGSEPIEIQGQGEILFARRCEGNSLDVRGTLIRRLPSTV